MNELSITDKGKVMACYNRIYEQTHGMTKRSETGRELNRPFQFGRVVGYVVDGKVRGYMVFSVEEKALHIHELFFETPEVMNEFSTFLNSQADQIDKIIFNANNDDILHFVHSPESEESPMTDFDSNVDNKHIAHVGAGVMYRIINCQGFFEELKEKEHTFGRETVNLKLVIADEFYPENHSSVILQINEGRLEEIRQDGHFDVELRMDIGGFSSLVMGAVNVTSLHKWGLAELSDKAYLRIINSLFTTDSRPAVTKAF